MITATADPARLREIQAQHGAAASEAVERTFAAAAARLAQGGITRFIVAGGRDSGSVTQALRSPVRHRAADRARRALGPRSGQALSLALMSGNLGGRDLLHRCGRRSPHERAPTAW